MTIEELYRQIELDVQLYKSRFERMSYENKEYDYYEGFTDSSELILIKIREFILSQQSHQGE
jgi:hypothetical protein